MIEFRCSLPSRVQFRGPPAALPDDESVSEVRHELDVLLLLLHPDYLQLLAEQSLELLLQAERERQPTHVAGIATLQEKDNFIQNLWEKQLNKENFGL